MKNYSLKPTEENAIELMRVNPINRNENVFRFVSLLDNIKESCTIAINGEWGSGKTFFVQQVKLILDAVNMSSPMDEQIRNQLLGLCPNKDEITECYATVYYDAWEYDSEDDPILSLVHAAITSNQVDFSPGREHSVMGTSVAIISSFLEILTKNSISDVLREAVGEDPLATLKRSDNIRRMVKEFIDVLCQEHGNRLVFFIDELDRCKPDYSIRFMERIEHYFDDDRVVFVFSVNLSQLQATAKKYYGTEFNASRYLDKFFDLRITLPTPDIKNYMERKLGFSEYTRMDSVCIEAAKRYRLSLRECERFARLVKICARPALKKESNTFYENYIDLFSVTYILPVMLVLQMTDVRKYAEFISGNNALPLLDILQWSNISFPVEWLVNRDETIDEEDMIIVPKGPDSRTVSIRKRLEEVYHAIFLNSIDLNFGDIRIGKMIVDNRNRRFLEETISLLSQISDYKYDEKR